MSRRAATSASQASTRSPAPSSGSPSSLVWTAIESFNRAISWSAFGACKELRAPVRTLMRAMLPPWDSAKTMSGSSGS